jgi:RNA polymerase sigma-70 factor (ECF subfamily)
MPLLMGSELVLLLPRLRRYALSLCKSPTLADDLVQSACLKALAHADGWTHGTRFDAWVFGILRNIWIDGLRRSRVEALVDNGEALDTQIDESGEDRALEKLTLTDVRRAIDALPTDQREVLLLVCVEDLAYREAAEVLGVPIGTVMSRLARARKKLTDITAVAV